MIKLQNVIKMYMSKSGASTTALDGVSMEFPASGMVFVLGKSGCGKSTLMNIIGGLDSATSGELLVNDVAIKDYKSSDYDSYRSQYISFIFQEYNLLDEYDVKSNINLALHLQGDKSTGKNKVSTALDIVGLKGFEDRRINEMSGGQKQRVAIARALVKNSSVILADEPTGNLDSKNAEEIFTLLKEVSREKLVIVVTHDSESAELYGDRIIEMSDGKVTNDRLVDKYVEQSSSAILQNTITLSSNSVTDAVRKITLQERITASAKSIEQQEVLDNINCTGKRNNGRKLDKSSTVGFGNILTLALKNTWRRKYRMIATIVLLVVALLMIGAGVSATQYRLEDTINELIDTVPLQEVVIAAISGNDDYYLNNESELRELFKDKNINLSYGPSDWSIPTKSYMIINDTVLKDYGFAITQGRIPKEYDELAISKLLADQLIDDGLYIDYNHIINTPIIYEPSRYKIEINVVGIVDTKTEEMLDKIYEGIDKYMPEEDKILSKESALYEETTYGKFSSSAMVSQSFINIVCNTQRYSNAAFEFNGMEDNLGVDFISQSIYDDIKMSVAEGTKKIRYADGFDKIEKDTVAVDINIAKNMVGDKLGISPNSVSVGNIQSYIDRGLYIESIRIRGMNEEERDTILKNIRVVGITERFEPRPPNYFPNDGWWHDKVVVSDDQGMLYNAPISVNISLGNDLESDTAIASVISKLNDTGQNVQIDSYYLYNIYFTPDLSNVITVFGLLAAVVFGIIASIMMLNYFFTIIIDSRKQIGILRSLGMTNSGVFTLYFTQALILVGIAALITFISLYPLFLAINVFSFSMLPREIMIVKVLKITFGVLGSIVGLCLLLAVAGSVYPITRIMKKKPIELINSKASK